ncbi:Uncharacterised protein [Mycobacteroides abscessus subsp. massiliense]|nr:Uncharacterised protein [Mycobacteroides abscessus subsp. massiliense]
MAAQGVHDVELAAHVVAREHRARVGLRCGPDHQTMGGALAVLGPLGVGQDRLAGHPVGAR